MARTVSGFWASVPPYRRLERSAPRDELGRAVLDALAASVGRIPDPDPSQEADPAFLQLAQARNWREFARGTKMVMVDDPAGRELAFVPTINGGPRHGFTERDDLGQLSASAKAPGEGGDRLLAALANAR
jgi:hypothetical protein